MNFKLILIATVCSFSYAQSAVHVKFNNGKPEITKYQDTKYQDTKYQTSNQKVAKQQVVNHQTTQSQVAKNRTSTQSDQAYIDTLGGLPGFEENETASIKGEGVGKGDKELISEKGGMPEFDISGDASCFLVASEPSPTYYDGKKLPDAITTNQLSTNKTNKDVSGLGFIAGEAYLKAKAKGNLSKSVAYGANIEIQAVKDDFGIDKMFIYLDNKKFGKLQLGNLKGPDGGYDFGAQSLIGGTAGIDGTLFTQLDTATGTLIPCHPIGYSNKATKLVYETPTWSGFTLGIAYTPDTKHHGHEERDRSIGDSSNGNNTGVFIKGDNDKSKPSGRDNFSIGIRHEYSFGNGIETKIAAFFLAENTQKITTTYYQGEITKDSKAETKQITLNDSRAWGVSATLKLNNISIAAGYFDSGKSRLPKSNEFENGTIFPAFMSDENGNAGHAYNVGLRYDYKRWATALVFHKAERKITKDQSATSYITSFTVDYLLRPGFKFFAEFDYIKTSSGSYACSLYNLNHADKNAISEQSGYMITCGAKVSF